MNLRPIGIAYRYKCDLEKQMCQKVCIIIRDSHQRLQFIDTAPCVWCVVIMFDLIRSLYADLQRF